MLSLTLCPIILLTSSRALPNKPIDLITKQKGANGGFDMNVEKAWQIGYTGKGVVVTILDDGIQPNHPDLELNYVSACANGPDHEAGKAHLRMLIIILSLSAHRTVCEPPVHILL